MRLSQERLLAVLAWVVILLVTVPVGGAVWLGVAHGESPCILCWAQRTSMVLVALTGLFVIRYGPRGRYLGLAVLLGAGGVWMALRHSALHLARDVGQGFAAPILGLHTYAWSFAVYLVALAVIGKLLFLRDDAPVTTPTPGRAGRFAMGLFMVVVGANAVQAFVTTGPPPFMGQADPVRFSLDPQRWVWSTEELAGRVSLRGAWTIPQPALGGLDPDPAHGPLANLPVLAVTGWEGIGTGLVTAGTLSGLARDPATGRYLAITDRHDVVVLDSTLGRVLHRVRLDPTFAIDLSPLAGAAFVGDTLAVVATNKSYVLLRPDTAVGDDHAWRRFLATDGSLRELARSRFATVRARQQYVLSLAWDPTAEELITVSVPSPRHPALVVSRFARSDLRLSSEFAPRPAAGLALGPERSLAEYVVSGAAVEGRTLWAVSASFATLLAVDLDTRMLRGAWAVPGLARPVGVAVRGAQLLVAQADGRVAVVERPATAP